MLEPCPKNRDGISDLTSGVHQVKLVYSPLFDDTLLFGNGEAFSPTAYAARFFEVLNVLNAISVFNAFVLV